MKTRAISPFHVLLLSSLTLLASHATAQTARLHTNLGDIDVILNPSAAPKTVANFINYINKGAYTNSVFHRSVPGFIIQGGGFQLSNHNLVDIPQDVAVRNEYSISNTRGTIAMAKLGSDPNSATNQWFFNESDTNASTLNFQNGGFTVFGKVADAASLAIMDKIATVPVPNPGPLQSPYDQIPLINYTGSSLTDSNYVLVLSINLIDAPSQAPAVASNGVVTASGFGGFASAAPGSFIEIYGTSLANSRRGWTGSDFTGANAPTSLDDVSVTIGGKPAFVNFVSPTQVNAQVPADVPTGGSLPVVVSYKGLSSDPVMLPIKTQSAGLLAPSTFNIFGKQYVAAQHADSRDFVSNGNLPGFPEPAVPGETLIFYGIGFGPVTPSSTPIAGQIVTGLTALTTPIQFKIGSTVAQVFYAGFVPGFVGEYQFNVVVPKDAPSGDLPVEVTLGGDVLAQTLFLPVQK
jgi:uncharacterized protein (TIGR03437 family)